MKYKGKEIGKPTLEMVREYILRKNFGFSAQIAYNHLEKELWQTRNGQPIQSLEAAINAYNGVYLTKQRKNSGFAGSLF
jgi:hypothetical protein